MSTIRIAHLPICALALMAFTGPVRGQSGPLTELAGDWKAAMDVNGTKLHLILHVSKTPAGLSASLDSIDQGAMALRVDTVRFGGSHLHFEMTEIGAQFDGDWNASARRIEGRWRQGPADLSLDWSQAIYDPVLRLSDEDRDYLLAYLTETRDGVLRAISHLTPAQWTYRPDPARWSIAECVEHLIIEEQTMYRSVTQQIVRMPLPDGHTRAGREQDTRIIQLLTDRGQKAAAAEAVRPHGTLATPEQGIAQFSKVRAETIDWVRTTQEDLRGHGAPNQSFQFLDAYGYWILAAAHSARHTAQMEEVKASPGYPK